ncbi:MAG: VOC family protein, partial [Nocardiopsaceae bacterium]|nr:VOC family protein [Nocardiopsaceae bacterium]
MQLSIQASLLNVKNLDQSVEFYQHVFDLPVMARQDRVAALMISEAQRQQVLLLREAGGSHPIHMGRGTIGSRLLVFEAG